MPHRGPPYTSDETPLSHHRQRRWIAGIAWLSLMAVIAAVASILAAYAMRGEEPFDPLQGPLYSGEPVPVRGEPVSPGGTVTMTIERCIDGPLPVLLFTTTRWETEAAPLITVPGTSSFVLAEPGCTLQGLAVVVPGELTPGQWEMEAIDGAFANTGPGIQVRTWRSAPVRVTR